MLRHPDPAGYRVPDPSGGYLALRLSVADNSVKGKVSPAIGRRTRKLPPSTSLEPSTPDKDHQIREFRLVLHSLRSAPTASITPSRCALSDTGPARKSKRAMLTRLPNTRFPVIGRRPLPPAPAGRNTQRRGSGAGRRGDPGGRALLAAGARRS